MRFLKTIILTSLFFSLLSNAANAEKLCITAAIDAFSSNAKILKKISAYQQEHKNNESIYNANLNGDIEAIQTHKIYSEGQNYEKYLVVQSISLDDGSDYLESVNISALVTVAVADNPKAKCQVKIFEEIEMNSRFFKVNFSKIRLP